MRHDTNMGVKWASDMEVVSLDMPTMILAAIVPILYLFHNSTMIHVKHKENEEGIEIEKVRKIGDKDSYHGCHQPTSKYKTNKEPKLEGNSRVAL